MEKIKIEKRKKSIKIALSGELGVDDAILLKEKLQKVIQTAEKMEIIFDKETEMHAAVIQIILGLQKYLSQSNKKFVVQNAQAPSVKNLLETLGCAQFLAFS